MAIIIPGRAGRATRPLIRAKPKLPNSAMMTYAVKEPVEKGKAATCAEVRCFRWRRGWTLIVARGSEEERVIRAASAGKIDHIKRAFKEQDEPGGLVRFDFGSGQACFRVGTHRISRPLGRLLVVRGGDWRQHTGLIRRHTRPADWVEDMQLNFDGVRRRIERG